MSKGILIGKHDLTQSLIKSLYDLINIPDNPGICKYRANDTEYKYKQFDGNYEEFKNYFIEFEDKLGLRHNKVSGVRQINYLSKNRNIYIINVGDYAVNENGDLKIYTKEKFEEKFLYKEQLS